MKDKMIQKLKNTKGESISEVLVAMLVVALGSVLFASMVLASYRIINNSNDAYQKYIDEHNEIEQAKDKTEASISLTESNAQADHAVSIRLQNAGESILLTTTPNHFIYEPGDNDEEAQN